MAQTIQLTVRATIMLLTMIAIPLIAIFGKQIPEIAVAIWQGTFQSEPWQTRPKQPVPLPPSQIPQQQLLAQQLRSDLSVAPRFVPATSTTVTSPNPALNTQSASLVVPAKFAEPRQLTVPDATPSAKPLQLRPMQADSLVQPASFQTAANTAAKHPVVKTESFQSAEQRLRALGMRYLKVETAGDGSQQFRCECQIAPPRGGPAQRFVALHADPLQAMQMTVAQVESWHADVTKANIIASEGRNRLR